MTKFDCPPVSCPVECGEIFEAMQVSYLIRGGTRVFWSLNPRLRLPLPWVFQLQYGTHPQGTTAWSNVGVPVTNAFMAVDSVQRDYGQHISGYYRVKLTADGADYVSPPVSVDGSLSARDWRIATEITRKERLRARFTAQDGYLLRARTTGNPCSRCLDIQTGEPLDSNCPNCRGTGTECGYYYPIDCVWADVAPTVRDIRLDEQLMQGTVADAKTTGRMLMMPPFLSNDDIWISQKLDQRYTIGKIKVVAEMRGVPLVADVELRLLPYTHQVYKIAIPQQDAWLTS
jgi:hypothetical protein